MTNNSQTIRHDGRVDLVEGNKVFVKIVTQSACQSCSTKSMCSITELKEKQIEVLTQGQDIFREGDPVTVILKRSMGNRAVILGYFFPFLVLIVSLLISSSFFGDLASGLIALISVGFYYLLMFIFRNRLKKDFHFRIQHSTGNHDSCSIQSGAPDFS